MPDATTNRPGSPGLATAPLDPLQSQELVLLALHLWSLEPDAPASRAWAFSTEVLLLPLALAGAPLGFTPAELADPAGAALKAALGRCFPVVPGTTAPSAAAVALVATQPELVARYRTAFARIEARLPVGDPPRLFAYLTTVRLQLRLKVGGLDPALAEPADAGVTAARHRILTALARELAPLFAPPAITPGPTAAPATTP